MATKTLYLTNTLSNNFHTLSESSPGTDAYASPVSGWKVAKNGSGNYAPLNSGNEYATFGATVYPDGSIDGTLGDCFRAGPFNGNFATGAWTLNFVVRANSSATGQDGRIGFRVFKGSNADGSGATEITGAVQNGAGLTDITTASDFNSNNTTWNPGGIALVNQYLFFQIGWEIQGAATNTNADVNFRIGTNSTRIITTDFTDNPALAGAANDVASATGALTSSMAVAGAANCVASATGSINYSMALASQPPVDGQWDGDSSQWNSDTYAWDADAPSAAVSQMLGQLTMAVAIAGSAACSSSMVGDITTGPGTDVVLAGAANSISTATGDLKYTMPLAGAASGVASATGALTSSVALAGAAAGVSSATGSITYTMPLAGAANSIASMAANLDPGAGLYGSAYAVASATGQLQYAMAVAGSMSATCSMTGSLGMAEPITGAATCIATMSGNLTVASTVALSGAANSVSTVVGNLTVPSVGPVALAGGASSVATMTGQLNMTVPLAGAMRSRAVADANLYSAKREVNLQGYAPGPVPQRYEDVRTYLANELAQIQAAIRNLAEGHVDVSYSAPAKPRNGDFRYADGVSWNPATGKGMYVYNDTDDGGSWVPLAYSGGRGEAGWRDLVGQITERGIATDPKFKNFRDGIYTWVFEDLGAGTQQEAFVTFHVDHDYMPNTPIYLHIHWSDKRASPSGTVRFGIEYTAAKGHDQQAFGATTTVYVEQAIDTQYQHMIAEIDVADAIPATNLEPDTLILVRVFANCNHVNYSLGADAFILTVDAHYQAAPWTSTKNKAPDFYSG